MNPSDERIQSPTGTLYFHLAARCPREASLSQRGDALLEQVLAASADHPLAPQVRGFAVGEGSEVSIHEMMDSIHEMMDSIHEMMDNLAPVEIVCV